VGSRGSTSRTALALVALALTAAPAFLGCGGDDDKEQKANNVLQVDEDFAHYSVDDVSKRFKRLTGVSLQGQAGGSTTLKILSLPSGRQADQARERYGGFLVSVTGNESTLKAILRRGGLGEHKVYDNVLVEATSSDPDAAAGFRRVLRVFDTLGKPTDQVKLPPEETPCERAGIDPDGGGKKEGTCKLGQQTLTVVNRGSTLKVAGKSIELGKVRIGSTITSRRYGFTRRVRAKGAFVGIAYRLSNRGTDPIDSLEPNLIIAGRRYTPDDENQYLIQPDSPFPVQPGDSAVVAVVYDIPVPAARKARKEGALEFIADREETSIEYAQSLGRIRLTSGPSGSGGTTS
jgi:hypothetical protein